MLRKDLARYLVLAQLQVLSKRFQKLRLLCIELVFVH